VACAAALVSALRLSAGTSIEFAAQVKTDIATLSSEPSLASWQKAHPRDATQPARYETEKDPFELDFRRTNSWCAASVNVSSSIVRAAMFYVPFVAPNALPALPQNEGERLLGQCHMEAIWYQTSLPIPLDGLANQFSAAWGKPNGPISPPDIPGSGRWKGFAWHRNGISIWVVYDAAGKIGAAAGAPRLIVYLRRNIPRDTDERGAGLFDPTLRKQMIAAACELAHLDPAPTREMLERSQCEAKPLKLEPESLAVNRLRLWLRASADAPPKQRAAALLVAHTYVGCAQIQPKALTPLGIASGAGCPQDGPAYDGSLLRQAENVDRQGPAGELAGLLSLGEPCSLKGRGTWPDLVIQKGNKLLNQFPLDQWTPWINFAVASAHAAKLSFAYSGGDPEGGGSVPLSAAAKQRERDAAIGHFEAFLQAKLDTPDSVFAWQAAWRLLAGLPASPVQFGCGCE